MVAEDRLDVRSVATLSPELAKARFGAAYVRAVCNHAGVGFTETEIDQDVQAVDGTVDFDLSPARVQIKCTGQFRINGGRTASWPSEKGWWIKWHRSGVPVYFVLVMVDPDEQTRWLDHLTEATLVRAAAFWVRVDTMSERPSITVPKVQRLTVATLNQWAAEVDACFGNVDGGSERAS